MIDVSNVDELYAAVNDPANVDSDVVLRAGRYVLAAHDSHGGVRPNGGRLELQPGMSLSGVEGHPRDVVIDAASSDAPVSPIRIGRSHETIEWLTAIGKPTTQAAILTDLVGDLTTSLRIGHRRVD